MIGKGKRRGNPKQLADHILNAENNEDIYIREIEGYPAQQLDAASVRKALGFMEIQGNAKGLNRLLYHLVLAPSDGEKLTKEQLNESILLFAKNLGLSGHAYVAVEHWKHGRQHFHIVLSLLNPKTGKLVDLKFDRRTVWNTRLELEKKFGLKAVISKGRSVRQWEHQRGGRGLDPKEMRTQITAIYKKCKTGKEFHAAIKEAGYILAKGRNGSYLLIDKFGHHHGVMRRIQGVTNKQFRQKFKDLKDEPIPTFESILRKRKLKRFGKKIVWHSKAVLFAFARAGRAIGHTSYRNPTARAGAFVRFGSLVRTKLPIVSAEGYRARVKQLIEESRKAAFPIMRRKKGKISLNPSLGKGYNKDEAERAELIAWAVENGRWDILAQYGFFTPENADL